MAVGISNLLSLAAKLSGWSPQRGSWVNGHKQLDCGSHRGRVIQGEGTSPLRWGGGLELQWLPSSKSAVWPHFSNYIANRYPPFWSPLKNGSHIFKSVVRDAVFCAEMVARLQTLPDVDRGRTTTGLLRTLRGTIRALGRQLPHPDLSMACHPALSLLDLQLSWTSAWLGYPGLLEGLYINSTNMKPQRINLLSDNSLNSLISQKLLEYSQDVFLNSNLRNIQFVQSSET